MYKCVVFFSGYTMVQNLIYICGTLFFEKLLKQKSRKVVLRNWEISKSKLGVQNHLTFFEIREHVF